MNTQPESLRLAHVADHPIPPDWSDMVAAVRELLQLHAENEALQQVYDARQLEIESLRDEVKEYRHGAGVQKALIETLLADKPAGEYPPLPTPDSYLFQHEETGVTQYVDSQQVEWGFEKNNPRLQRIGGAFTEAQMRAYVDTDRAMRAQADSQPALPEITAEDRSFLHDNPNTDDIVKWVQHYASAAITADRAMRAQAAPVAQGDAQQRAMDARHAAIYRWIIQHIDKAASIIDAWREDGEADKDELHDALAARSQAKEGVKP